MVRLMSWQCWHNLKKQVASGHRRLSRVCKRPSHTLITRWECLRGPERSAGSREVVVDCLLTTVQVYRTYQHGHVTGRSHATVPPAHAKTPTQNANTDISVKTVTSPAMETKPVRKGPNEIFGLQPKYLRHNLWQKDAVLSPTTAEWSETANPLPRPPLSEILNPISSKTIADNPNLFQVRTPIKVDVFESLLEHHPNPSFIKSICAGLREGFWPWADTLLDSLPQTHDESRPMPLDDKQASFIRDQCAKEQQKGFFSDSFGTHLLPGMYSMPIYAVPKPHSIDLRLVTDHSTGPYSLNSMIDHSKVTGFPLDNVCHHGEMLYDVRRSIGNVSLTLWKSDIADAYRLLPMSPYWQIKQIITIDGQRYVDHNLAFGSSGSPGIFISFNSLVAWIAKHVKGIDYLFDYVDDSLGCNLLGDTQYYEPYQKYLLTNQTRLLLLWDELGIPHKPHKQIFGNPLTIIGIDVDANRMTLTLPQESRLRLIDELHFWQLQTKTLATDDGMVQLGPKRFSSPLTRSKQCLRENEQERQKRSTGLHQQRHQR